ncbi:unnamed protein product [Ascophyllum nodosum]
MQSSIEPCRGQECHGSKSNSSRTRSPTESDQHDGNLYSNEIKRKGTKSACISTDYLDQRALNSAISSGLSTSLLKEGVPAIDRRAKRFLSPKTLDRKDADLASPHILEYPPAWPLCLRGHTPTTTSPSRVRVDPKRSVRGPRGATDVPNGAFAKPGVLGGLCVSPWVVEEEKERVQRALSHRNTMSKDPLVFRRKRPEGGLMDYVEKTHKMKSLLDKIHPLRDESCPPKSGFSYRRVCHDTEPPGFYDTCPDVIRRRTVVGFSPAHIRGMSPTPCLTRGGKESVKTSLDWGDGCGDCLGGGEGCCGGGISRGGSLRRLHSVRTLIDKGKQDDPTAFQMPRTWSGQDLPPPWDAPSPSYIPRPFLPSRDHLGRPMSRGILSRATSGLKPLQFDTSQRRREYTAILAAKKHVRLLREAAEMVAAELEKENRERAAEGQQGIDIFEGNLDKILKQKKRKYL